MGAKKLKLFATFGGGSSGKIGKSLPLENEGSHGEDGGGIDDARVV